MVINKSSHIISTFYQLGNLRTSLTNFYRTDTKKHRSTTWTKCTRKFRQFFVETSTFALQKKNRSNREQFDLTINVIFMSHTKNKKTAYKCYNCCCRSRTIYKNKVSNILCKSAPEGTQILRVIDCTSCSPANALTKTISCKLNT